MARITIPVAVRICLSTLLLAACATLQGAGGSSSEARGRASTLPPPPQPSASPAVTPVGRPTYFPELESFPALNAVRTLAFAPDGRLWAGTTAGVVAWDVESGIPSTFGTGEGVAAELVNDLVVTGDGLVWAATQGGISRFDGAAWRSWTEQEQPGGLPAYSLAVAADGSIWAGTASGAARFDGARWTPFLAGEGPAGAPILYAAAAPDGDVWFSTHGAGVSRYRAARNSWITYLEQLPLPNARALAISPDGEP